MLSNCIPHSQEDNSLSQNSLGSLSNYTHHLTTHSTTFQTNWIHRCLNENAIDPAVFEANIDFISGQDIYTALNWEVPKQRGFGGLRPWNEGAAFVGEDGEIWQVRLDVPRETKDGKVHKYESPRGRGARLFFPSVPPQTRDLISKRWGVEVPLTGSFWAWFNSSKEARAIPLFPTEGGTKALSLISQGFASLSLYGSSAAWQKRESKYDRRELLPQLREAVRGRSVSFCFDSDVKPTAQIKVRQSIAMIGKAIGLLATEVKVVSWNSDHGKGVDDFISSQGIEAFERCLGVAPNFKNWKTQSLDQWAKDTYNLYAARAKADYQAIAPTVLDCGFRLPELGEALLSDAAMGLGKTHAFGEVIKALRREYPDLIVDAIGHRNNLLLQTSKRLGLTHIHQTGAGKHTQTQIDNEPSLAYCADSLWRRFDSLIAAMARGQKLLLILDEIDALIKHILLSETIKQTKRIHLIRKFSALLQAIGNGGGWVIGGEAALTQLAVDSLEKLSLGKLKVTVAANRMKPAPWQCTAIDGWKETKSGPVTASAKQCAMQAVSEAIERGEKVALLTTSQQGGEQFDRLFSDSGVKVWRLDSKTSPEKENRQAFQDMAGFIRSSDAQLFILTPTVESGVSIDGTGLVDRIVLYSSGLEPNSSYQLLGRFRDPSISRILCVEARGHSPTRSGTFDPAEFIDTWRERTGKVMAANDFMAEVTQEITIAHEIAATYKAREAAGIVGLRENLFEKLRSEGHQIESVETEIGNYDEALKAAKEAINDTRAQDWKNADDSQFTADQAREKLKDSDLTWIDRVLCHKAIERERVGDLVDQDTWIDKFWRDEREGRELKSATRTASELKHDGMAAESDRMTIARQLRATGTVWGPEVSGRDLKIQTLKKLNLDCLLPFVGKGFVLHSGHYAVRAVFNSARQIVDEVSEHLGLNPTTETNPLEFVKDLFGKRLGYEFETKRVRVPKSNSDLLSHENPLNNSYEEFGDSINTSVPENEKKESNPPKRKRGRPKKAEPTTQIRVYAIEPCPHHAEMVEAFKASHDRAVVEFSQEPESSPESKLQPGRAINWGGQLWTVVAVRNGFVYLSEGQGVAPLDMCPRIPIEMVTAALGAFGDWK